MFHNKYIRGKVFLALAVICGAAILTILTFEDLSPGILKTFVAYSPYGGGGPEQNYTQPGDPNWSPETDPYYGGPDPSMMMGPFGGGMPVDFADLANLPNINSILTKMGYKVPIVTAFANAIQPYIPELKSGTPSMALMGIMMQMNPTNYLASTEGKTIVAELKKDLNYINGAISLFKTWGCNCGDVDSSCQEGFDALTTERPYFAGLNLADIIKSLLQTIPGLLPLEKFTQDAEAQNFTDINTAIEKLEWITAKGDALSYSTSSVKSLVTQLKNLKNVKPKEKVKEPVVPAKEILAPVKKSEEPAKKNEEPAKKIETSNAPSGGSGSVGNFPVSKQQPDKSKNDNSLNASKGDKKPSADKPKTETKNEATKESKSKTADKKSTVEKTSEKTADKSVSKSKNESESKLKDKSKSKSVSKSKDKSSDKSLSKSKTKSSDKSDKKAKTNNKNTKGKSKKSSLLEDILAEYVKFWGTFKASVLDAF